MSSSISHFDPPRTSPWRKLTWIFATVVAVTVIEAFVAVVHPTADQDRNNIFEYRPGRAEDATRLFVAEKMKLFGNEEPTIVQVGDSSGFHGVQPPVVEALLPHVSYLNMSVFANLGYSGHYEMARHILEHSRKTKYLVLYFTPANFQPNADMVSAKNLLGDDIQREYNSPVHRLVHLPSLAFRKDVTDLVYYGAAPSSGDRELSRNTRYPEASTLLPESGGWTREHDNADDVAAGVLSWVRSTIPGAAAQPVEKAIQEAGAEYGDSPDVFDWRHLRWTSMADQVFERFRTLAQAHGARLIIAAAPVSDIFRNGEVGRKLTRFEATLERYRAAHPDVGLVPMEFWPDARFSSPVHVATSYTRLNTIRFAQALKAAIGPDELAALKSPVRPERPVAANIDMANPVPGYGFSAALPDQTGAIRTIRAGRSESLLFARIAPDATEVRVDIAAGTPPEILQGVSLSVSGLLAQRVEENDMKGDPPFRQLAWRLPPGTFQYGGWVEVMISTRGLVTWPGDQLEADASGPLLQISKVRFD